MSEADAPRRLAQTVTLEESGGFDAGGELPVDGVEVTSEQEWGKIQLTLRFPHGSAYAVLSPDEVRELLDKLEDTLAWLEDP